MAYLLIQILYNPINTDLTKYFINDSVVKEYWDYIMHLTYSDSKYKGKPINLTLLPNPTGMAKGQKKNTLAHRGNFPIFKPSKSN
ncbi:MAG: hypothetical protein HS127_10900 [Planctomycetia bacterium]|nr:hypothetical protein [Planctomycetia bacterium]